VDYKKLYNEAIRFLLSFEQINQEDLDKHLDSEYKKPKDIKIIYEGFCVSAQNKQMCSRVIGGSIGGVHNLKEVLFDFNPLKVAKRYNRTDDDILLDEIKTKLNPKGQIRTENKSLWPQYCKSIIDSAHFLKSFETADKFYDWTNLFAKDSKSKPALPLMISIEIRGLGFPLACDLLKELGFTEYGKPDVHLKDIFKALSIIDPFEKSSTKQDYDTLKAIDAIAEANNVTSYAVDKVFWLIGSGNFYLTDKNIGRQKKVFIEMILASKVSGKPNYPI